MQYHVPITRPGRPCQPTAACASPRSAVYRRRQAERTLLYRTVQTHLAIWLALHDDGAGETAPAVTERKFRGALECGIVRARCIDCKHDFLVAYSCKCRGICPSCTTRRMAESAVHLADHVIPRLPVRQWVLSVPKRLRYFLQNDSAIATVALHIFLRAVEQALRRGCPVAGRASRISLIVFLHYVDALLNPHLHFHCVVVDGVFEADERKGATFSQSSSS